MGGEWRGSLCTCIKLVGLGINKEKGIKIGGGFCRFREILFFGFRIFLLLQFLFQKKN